MSKASERDKGAWGRGDVRYRRAHGRDRVPEDGRCVPEEDLCDVCVHRLGEVLVVPENMAAAASNVRKETLYVARCRASSKGLGF